MSRAAAIANASIAAARVRRVWTAGSSSNPNGPLYSAGGGESNGKLCVIGGNNWASTEYATQYAYDPGSDTWTAKASHPAGVTTQQGGGSILGKAICLGGTNGGSDQTHHYWYDHAANTFTAKAAHPTVVRYPAASNLADTFIDSVGGFESGSYSSYHQLYDVSANAWTAKSGNPNGSVYGGSGHGSFDSNAYSYYFSGFNGTINHTAYHHWDRVANAWTHRGYMALGFTGGRGLDALDGIGHVMGRSGQEILYTETDIDGTQSYQMAMQGFAEHLTGSPCSAHIGGKIYVFGSASANVKILTPRVTPRAIKRLLGLIASS